MKRAKLIWRKMGWYFLTLGLVFLSLVFTTPAQATIYFTDNADGTLLMSRQSPWATSTTDFYSRPQAYVFYASETNNANKTLSTTNSFSLVGSTNPYLTFWHFYDFEKNGDYGRVEISTNGGTTWNLLRQFTGMDLVWSQPWISLADYKSSNNVRLRFIFQANNNGSVLHWTVDNIRVAEMNPSVTVVSPSSGANSVPTGTGISITFDRPMNPATINASTIQLRDNLGTLISGAVSYSNNVAVFKPDRPLASSTLHTVTVSAGVKCAEGQLMGSPYTWSFTTMNSDSVAPTGSISFGSEKTSSTLVTMNISASDDNSGVAKMQFSNTNGPWDGVPWRPYSTTDMWLLTSGEGEKTVYARFMDHANNISGVFSANVTYEAFTIDYFSPYTKVPRQVLTGTVDNGWTVSVETDTFASDGSAVVVGNTWMYAITDLKAGVNNITVRAQNGGQSKILTEKINLVGYFWDYVEGSPKMRPYANEGEWTVVEGVYHTAPASYHDSPAGNYNLRSRTWLYSDPINLAASAKPYLYFKHKRFLGASTTAAAQASSGSIVTGFGSLTGGSFTSTSGDWTSAALDLSTYKSFTGARIRFHLDTSANPGDGWYIDDIFVGEYTDSTSPTGGVSINDGDVGTNSTSVTLNLTASDTESQVALMQFSNDMALWSAWEDFDATKQWVLQSGTGIKTVYVRYKDSAGNVSSIYNDTIYLDNTPPVMSLNPATPTEVTTNTLTITGTSNDENPVVVKIATDTEASDGYATVSGTGPLYNWSYTITNLVQGNNIITITGSDVGGNTADDIVHTVNLNTATDANPPTGVVKINNDAIITNNTSVVLSVEASDSGAGESGIAKMRFKNEGGAWDDWVLYQPSYNWIIEAGNDQVDDVTRVVYAEFKDAAGRVSATVMDSILLDIKPPQLSLDAGPTTVDAFVYTITGTASDKNGIFVNYYIDSGAMGNLIYCFNWDSTTPVNTGIVVETNISRNAGATWEGWQPVTNGQPYLINEWHNARLQYRVVLSTTDSAVTPTMHSLQVARTDTGSDITQVNFSSGTLSNVEVTGDGKLVMKENPNVAFSKTYTNSHSTYSYHDTNAREFTDGLEGSTIGDGRSFAYYYTSFGVGSTGTGILELTVDLDDLQWVNSAKLCSSGGTLNYAAHVLEILTSVNGVDYVTRGTVGTIGTNSKYLTVNFSPVQARWVKFKISKKFASSQYYLFIDEGYVYTTGYAASGSFTSPVVNLSDVVVNEFTPFYADIDQNNDNWSAYIRGLIQGVNNIRVTATDAAGNTTTATTALTSNFWAYNNDGTDANSTVREGAWGIISSDYSSAPSCWSSTPTGSYTDPSVSEYFMTTNTIDLSPYRNPSLSIRLKWNIPTNYNSVNGRYDEGEIQYWHSNGNWYNLNTGSATYYRGNSGGWTTRTYSLRSIMHPNFKLRFRFATNGDGIGGTGTNGFLIDDIKIWEVESVAPWVLANFPWDGTENLPINTPVWVYMSEPTQSSGGSFTISGPSSVTSKSHSVKKVTSNSTALKYDGLYTVTVSGLVDSNGNAQVVPKIWTFRTEKDTYPPSGSISIVNQNGTGTWTNSQLVRLNLSATDPNSGAVTMMRFSNDGLIWSPWESYMTTRDWIITEGDGLKRVYVQFKDTYNNLSTVVNNTINLDTVAPVLTINPVVARTNVDNQVVNGAIYDLNSATVYVATDTEASDGAASVVNSTLLTGTWSYSIISFEPGNNVVTVTATDPAGNRTTVVANIFFDTVLPTVINVSPVNNAIELPVNTVVTATFSEPMNPATITSSHFIVKDNLNNTITGTLDYTGNTVTFTPNGNLTMDTLYTVTITTGVRDLAGNAMEKNLVWSFKTIDQVPPQIGSTSPVNGNSEVPVNKIITVNFNEKVKKGNNFAGITLKVGSTVLEATYTINGNVLFIHPDAYLENSTLYEVTIPAGGIQDLAGNDLVALYNFSFTTVAADAPPPPFAQISAGNDFNMAVKGDGALVSWGSNDDGQLGDGKFREIQSAPVLVRGADGTVWTVETSDFSAGNTHAVVVTADGKVWGWGQNAMGQLGNGVADNLIGPPFGKLYPVRAKFAGNDWVHTVVYQNDFAGSEFTNTVATTSDNVELSMTDSRIRTKFNTNAFENGFTVTKDGGTQASRPLYGWSTLASAYRFNNGGSSTFSGFGYFEIARPDYSVRTVIPLNLINGADRTFDTRTFNHDGATWEVKYGWATTGIFSMEVKQTVGEKKNFKIRFGGTFGSTVERWGFVPKIWTDATGEEHTLYTWWHNDNNQDELNKACPQFTFTVVPFSNAMNRKHTVEPYTVNSSGNSYTIETLSLTEGTTLYFQWGNAPIDRVQNWIVNDLKNELAYPSTGTMVSPVLNISEVSTAQSSTINWNATVPVNTALTVQTKLSLDGGVTWSDWQNVSNGGAITGISSGTNLSNGRLQYRANMSNTNIYVTPQLHSLGINIYSNSPPFTATSVYGGTGYTAGLQSDGTVWVWGANNYGQLGDGTQDTANPPRPTPNPVQVPGLTGITAIAPGASHILALKNDGTVWAWGKNDFGQLGDGTYSHRFTPAQVPGLAGVIAVATGTDHSAALTSDGTVWTWGYNIHGQLGRPTAPNDRSPIPTQVPSLSSVIKLESGRYHNIVLRADGTVWAWGRNVDGQVGDGTFDKKEVPTQVLRNQTEPTEPIIDVVAISAGGDHNLALKDDGTIWSWGRNHKGQLGDGSTVSKNKAVQVIVDTAGPVFLSSSPADGAENIANNSKITATFDENIDPVSVNNMSFVVMDTVSGAVYEGTITVSDKTITFTPKGNLAVNSLHKVIVKPGIKDMVGNPSKISYSWNFTTGDVTGPNCEVIINSGDEYATTRFVTLNVSSDDDSGVVSHMQFSNDGLNWAPWQSYEETTSWNLSAGEGTKRVSVRFRDPAGNTSAVYHDEIVLHTIPPIITGSNVLDAVYIQPGANVTISFDENIKEWTTYNQISLRSIGGELISIQKSISGSTLTLIPQTELARNTLYTVTIPAEAVADVAGNGLQQAWVRNFTVGPDTIPPSVLAVPGGGTYVKAVTVALLVNEPADIYYTIDGSVPNTSSILYTGPISIYADSELKYLAVDRAGNQSEIATQQYSIDPTAESVIGNSWDMDKPKLYGDKAIFANMGLLTIYNLKTGDRVTVMEGAYGFNIGDFDPVNGKVTYTYYSSIENQSGLIVADILKDTHREITTYPGMGIFAGAVSGEILAYYDESENVTKLLNLETGEERVLTADSVEQIDIAGDEVVYKKDSKLLVKDINTWLDSELRTVGNISDLSFGTDPNLIYWVENGDIKVYDRSRVADPVVVDSGSNPFVQGKVVFYDKMTPSGTHIFAKDLETDTVLQYTYGTGVQNVAPVFMNNRLLFKRGQDTIVRDFNQEPPVVSVSHTGEFYPGPIEVGLVSDKPGTQIYYTLNDENPVSSETAQQYIGPINIDRNLTLKYYGVDPHNNSSGVVSKNYCIGNDIIPPSIIEAVNVDDRVTISYNEPLNTSVIPALTDFQLYADGESISVSNISAKGSVVTLRTVSSIVYGQTVTLDYFNGGRLRDLANIPAQAVTNWSVTNLSTMIVPVEGISLNKATLELTLGTGETVVGEALIPTITPTKASNRKVFWSSNNPGVAEVNQNGYVIAKGIGSAIITVTTEDGGHSAHCTVNVLEATNGGEDNSGDDDTQPVAVTGVSLNKATLALNVGASELLLATVQPVEADNKAIEWSSSASAVATVDQDGLVRGVAPGTAVIKVRTVDGGKEAICEVTVANVTNSETGSSPSGPSTPSVSTETITATVLDPATNKQGAEVTSKGAVIQTTDQRVTLYVPKDALSSDTILTVTPLSTDSLTGSFKLVANSYFASDVFEFGPAGTVFSKPITMTLKFDKSQITNADQVAPYYFNEQTGVWELVAGYSVNLEQGTVSFPVSHFSKYAILGSRSISFEDMRNHWAKDFVQELVAKGIIKGRSEKLFAPDAKITRAEFARMLVGALGLAPVKTNVSSFADVHEKAWYFQWVETAYKAGLVKGSGGSFLPDNHITRQEMAVMIVNALTYQNKSLQAGPELLNSFADKDQVADWARDGVAKAVQAKVVNGRTADKLAPKDNASRAEAAVMIKQLVDLL